VQARGEQKVLQAQAGPRPPVPVPVQAAQQSVPVVGQVRALSPPLARQGQL